MKSKGRPATRPIKLMDGFYIEVRNRGSKDKGVKIRNVTKELMDTMVKHYERSNKEVNVLGEHKDDKWVNDKAAPKKPKVPKVPKEPKPPKEPKAPKETKVAKVPKVQKAAKPAKAVKPKKK